MSINNFRASHCAVLFAMCASLICSHAQGESESEEVSKPAERESPWLFAPIITSDPKLGTSFGAVAGYLYRFDQQSNQSIFTTFGTYSDTDSYFGGAFADTYFGANQHKLKAGIIGGRVRNDYEDFLGTGLSAKTEDDVEAFFLRYSYLIGNQWYLGGQFISSNYVIGADGLLEGILEQVGLVGFDSNGLGLVAEYDTRDNVRNATRGQRFIAHNVAYREALGGDQSFDTYRADYTHYTPFGDGHVLGVQATGRWTHDAPLGGYSSVMLRGYTRGNYLAEHYSHIDLDARFHIRGKWGAAVFAGVGCLYATASDCNSSEALFPAVGAGVIYTLKPAAGIVIRAEYAVGDSGNSAFYLRLGQPF